MNKVMKVLFWIGFPIRLFMACLVWLILSLSSRDKEDAKNVFKEILIGKL